MTSVSSDDYPPSQSPTTSRSKSGSKSTNSRHVQELPTVHGDGTNPTSVVQSEDQSRSASIAELQRTIDTLRAQQMSLLNGLTQSRRSHFSGDGDEHRQITPSGEDRLHSGQSRIGEDREKEWKLEIKRWKRVRNRAGFSDIYDESEKIEDIRKREREIRSGGVTPCVMILSVKADHFRLRSFRLR